MLCPCESDFHGSTNQADNTSGAGGCPRCSGTYSGPVAVAGGASLPKRNKLHTIDWLLTEAALLPDTARAWLQWKGFGTGPTGLRAVADYGPTDRHAVPPRIANRILKIYADRLGIRLDDAQLSTPVRWLTSDDAQNFLGLYDSSDKTIAVIKNLREWPALDVYAHEVFHKIQFELADFFAMDRLAGDKIPYKPNLFLEGAAVWAASHVVEALAIRGILSANNLREGNEYGEGLQALKLIEDECGGIDSVLRFLRTGDIADATNGQIKDLPALCRRAGVPTTAQNQT